MNYLIISYLALAFATIDYANCHSYRIIGGESTTIVNHPYQASIQRYNQHHCGGALVAPRYVLTAAHCLKNIVVTNLKLRTGSTYHAEGGHVHDVEDGWFHPRHDYYDSMESMDFDIGVLQLKRDIKYSVTTQPIVLIPLDEEPRPSEMVTAIGWGTTSLTGKDLSASLRKVRMPIIDRDLCNEVYQEYDEIDAVNENMVCAGGSFQSAYSGDSGGPVTNDKNQLIGLVSWSRIGMTVGYPSVFTNLANREIRKFIRTTTHGNVE